MLERKLGVNEGKDRASSDAFEILAAQEDNIIISCQYPCV
jgi:hypothetical protein